MNAEDVVIKDSCTVCLTMRGEDLSMLMTVRLTLRRSLSIISWTCPLVGPCTDRRASGTITSWNTATQTCYRVLSALKGRFTHITKKTLFSQLFGDRVQIFWYLSLRFLSTLQYNGGEFLLWCSQYKKSVKKFIKKIQQQCIFLDTTLFQSLWIIHSVKSLLWNYFFCQTRGATISQWID